MTIFDTFEMKNGKKNKTPSSLAMSSLRSSTWNNSRTVQCIAMKSDIVSFTSICCCCWTLLNIWQLQQILHMETYTPFWAQHARYLSKQQALAKNCTHKWNTYSIHVAKRLNDFLKWIKKSRRTESAKVCTVQDRTGLSWTGQSWTGQDIPALWEWTFHCDDCEEQRLPRREARLCGIYLSNVRRNVLLPPSWLTSDCLWDRAVRALRVGTVSSTHTSRPKLATVFFLISGDASLPDSVEVQVQLIKCFMKTITYFHSDNHRPDNKNNCCNTRTDQRSTVAFSCSKM
jgi:hypothetical protein